jgi:hypothetical protein
MKDIKTKLGLILRYAFTFFIAITFFGNVYTQEYQPRFWYWPYTSKEALDVKTKDMKWLKDQGWYGIGVATASNEPGGKYFFPSPTLSDKSWANYVEDRATPLIKEAHANGLKFMANMEWINPNFWPDGLKYWTPDLLKGVVKDLKNIGIDRWFDECFNLWSDLGSAISQQCNDIDLEYEEGSDGMHIFGTSAWQNQKTTTYPEHYIHTNPISLYHYGYYRDTLRGGIIAQQGTIAYGYAKHWNKKTALVYTMGNWGTPSDYWPGILRATCLIRGLQFRVNDYMIIKPDSAKGRQLNIPSLKNWINIYTKKQEINEKRLVLNIVSHLTAEKSEAWQWALYTYSSDAITSGAFHAGYDIVCSEEPIQEADAYYIYTSGTSGKIDNLTTEIVNLFNTKKTVFIQCGGTIPSDTALTNNWKTVLKNCGIGSGKSFRTTETMPSTGIYKGKTVRFTGMSSMKGSPGINKTNSGTVLPTESINGTIYVQSGTTPLIVGQNKKYLITGSCLNWQMNYVIGDLLTGYGTSPQSNVWGIAGNSASAFLAIANTTLELRIPNLPDGQKIHVVQYDKYYNKIYDAEVKYISPYKRSMNQFDLIAIDCEFNNNKSK